MTNLIRSLQLGSSPSTPSIPVDYSNLKYSIAPTAGLSQRLGNSVAISNNYAAGGAPNAISGGISQGGVVYIYNLSTGAITYTLQNPDNYTGTGGDQFGYSVDLDDTHVIVGAPQEDDSTGTSTGAAYIFRLSDGTLVHTLTNPNVYGTVASDQFGYSVAISGNYALVGTPFEDTATGTTSGTAYLFNVTTGALIRTIENPNPYSGTGNDNFANSVDINSSLYIIGAWGEDEVGYNQSGKAYIYDIATGDLVYTLNNPGAAFGSATGQDYFGYSVSLSDNYAMVSAHREYASNGTTSFAGRAYIYNLSDGSLLHTIENPNNTGQNSSDQFGWCVSICNSYAIASAIGEDIGGNNSGIAYVFDTATGSLVHTLYDFGANGDTTASSDQYGYSVSISNAGIIVGAPQEDDSVSSTSTNGAVYIYG